jgi:hypothetical protein
MGAICFYEYSEHELVIEHELIWYLSLIEEMWDGPIGKLAALALTETGIRADGLKRVAVSDGISKEWMDGVDSGRITLV